MAQAAAEQAFPAGYAFVETDGKAKLQSRPIRAGDEFLTVKVRHARTGILAKAIRPKTLFATSAPPLAAGQIVFGVSFKSGGVERTAWCAPRRTNGAYETICLVPTANGYFWDTTHDAAMAPTLTQNYLALDSDPIVQTDPVSLPSMVLTLKLRAARMDHTGVPAPEYTIECYLDWGEGEKFVSRRNLEFPPDGRVVSIAGENLLFKPGVNGTDLIVDRPSG